MNTSDKNHIPAAQDVPFIVATLQCLINEMATEIALLQHRVMKLEGRHER